MEEADRLGDVEGQLSGAPGGMARRLGDKQKQVRPVLYVDELAVFEDAISVTGITNRGQALLAVCHFYIENSDNEKRQQYAEAKNLIASQDAGTG